MKRTRQQIEARLRQEIEDTEREMGRLGAHLYDLEWVLWCLKNPDKPVGDLDRWLHDNEIDIDEEDGDGRL